MAKPLISVVITAYNRREYLRYAVKSVLNQTLDRNFYEVIVIKNFEDSYTDKLIEGVGRTINVDIASIGAKIALGIRESEGEVVAFLEDDDLWHSRKLEHVAEAFRNNNDLMYYHHNTYAIDKYGNIIHDSLIERTNINNYVYASNEDEKMKVFKQYGWGLGLRNSSIAVRRDVYEKYAPIIRLLPDAVDVALYLVALSVKGSIIHEPRRLMFFRIHETNTSSVRFAPQSERLHRVAVNSVKHTIARYALATIARHIKPQLTRYAGYDEASIVAGILANWRGYTAVMSLNLLNHCKSLTCLATAILGIINTISPELTKRIITLYYTKGFRL
ncbi:glycosyltransferase [Caldivirga maquilingensis]|uniref:Glycosyl transferase family 2 n=1 Tax=Caldivirga maquilingensis (strain ATCC 700844 / DSM 13496 / JCM 10307 / IC-167) TaxID=397948 RepID=A8M950_CALMQ|nr:glycosyltransferase [Caldivirga maquilingensis]ABW02269.1 glycosyl transferase family 2 [Caldivirga maquilingensis IC-167]